MMTGFSTFMVLLLGALSVVQAQRTCYSCSGEYRVDSTEDVANCFAVNADTLTDGSCDGQCSTEIRLTDGSIRIARGCQRTAVLDACNDCTDPEDCLMCCSTADNCNSQTLATLLQQKALTQTCYSCRFSEIPGVKSESGCGLNFAATGLDTMQCPGMCYSSSSYIPGIEDIVRGCAYFGNNCDADFSNLQQSVTERNNIYFKRSCCMGDNCNSAMTVKAGTLMLTVAIIVGMFVPYRF